MIIIIIILQQKIFEIHHHIQSYINITLPGFRLATFAFYFRNSALHFPFLFQNQYIFVPSSGSLAASSDHSFQSAKSKIECNRGTCYIIFKLEILNLHMHHYWSYFKSTHIYIIARQNISKVSIF